MSLFDDGSEEPQNKKRRYVVTGVFFVFAVAATLWYLLRFETEKDTVRQFMETVARGDFKAAYELWNPADRNAYPFDEFLADWGPQGYYGPVKSFRISAAGMRKRTASGVIVAVEVCPEAPFRNDPARNKEVQIWVERRDQSLSFPP